MPNTKKPDPKLAKRDELMKKRAEREMLEKRDLLLRRRAFVLEQIRKRDELMRQRSFRALQPPVAPSDLYASPIPPGNFGPIKVNVLPSKYPPPPQYNIVSIPNPENYMDTSREPEFPFAVPIIPSEQQYRVNVIPNPENKRVK